MVLPAQPKVSILWALREAWARKGTKCLPQQQEICLLVPGAKESGHTFLRALISKDKVGLHKVPVYLLI